MTQLTFDDYYEIVEVKQSTEGITAFIEQGSNKDGEPFKSGNFQLDDIAAIKSINHLYMCIKNADSKEEFLTIHFGYEIMILKQDTVRELLSQLEDIYMELNND